MLKQDLIRIKQKMCQHIYTTTRRPDVVFFYVIFNVRNMICSQKGVTTWVN